MYNRHNVQKKVTPIDLSRKKIGNMTTCSKARPVDALPNPRLWHCLCGEIKSNHIAIVVIAPPFLFSCRILTTLPLS
jgi:hypothetical protein